MAVSILLVDDHRILRDGLRLRLHQEPDFRVVGDAANAAEAYQCVERLAPEVVIMDVNLPGDNGLVATTRIKTAWPNTRVIILTGEFAAHTAQDAMLAGANGFLRKEDASDELTRAVRSVMEGKTYLSPDAATAVTLALLAKSDAPKEIELSERELAVLKGLAEGLSYKEVAAGLGIGAKSVETYRARLVRKTGYATRADLVRYAIRRGLVKA
jgi:DNA-binding NarL/FixJ family response regulator